MALETVEGGDRIRNVPIMSHILGSNGARAPATQPRRAQAPGPRHPSLSFMNLQGPNVDLAVLRPENQNRTHVTPLIDQLASKLFREQLVIVGPRPRPVDKEEVLRRKTQLRARLQSLLEKGPDTKKPYFSAADQLRDEYWRKVLIREAWYNVSSIFQVLSLKCSG